MAYLDHAASTPVRPEAIAAWHESPFGNPASVHGVGRAARRALEEAREAIAAHLGVTAAEVVFTSSGTAADNLALVGIHRGRRRSDSARDVVLVSAVEHPAVAATADAAAAASAGTLTATFTVTEGASAAVLNCNAVSSLTQTTLAASWQSLTNGAGLSLAQN